MRIVVVMIEPPLPFGNAAARWFYVLLKGLVARGHQVTAFAACSRPEDIPKARQLFPAPEYDLRCFPFPERAGGLRSKLESFTRPYSYMFSDELRRELDRELKRGFDVLHLEQLWSAWVGLEHVDRALVNVHHLTWIDLEYTRPTGTHNQLTQTLMTLTERQLVRRMKYFRSCSPRLVPEMLRENPDADITTIPVGVDPEQYRYIPDDQRTGAPVVSVIGTMGWYPTHSAAVRLLTRLWPRIKERVPEAKAQVVGWSARSALSDFLDMPDVTIEENVPDIQPYFERTGVLLYAPGRGSGMKIKILEALGFGVPVVTTSEGVEGLPALDGVHAGVTEDDEGLVERAVALLRDPGLQNRQRRAGRALLEEHCGPGPTLDALERLYARMGSR
ncbi:glycosyltransferase family 4 protein [Myxococcaceae bacterium GXIMD 01537]